MKPERSDLWLVPGAGPPRGVGSRAGGVRPANAGLVRSSGCGEYESGGASSLNEDHWSLIIRWLVIACHARRHRPAVGADHGQHVVSDLRVRQAGFPARYSTASRRRSGWSWRSSTSTTSTTPEPPEVAIEDAARSCAPRHRPAAVHDLRNPAHDGRQAADGPVVAGPGDRWRGIVRRRPDASCWSRAATGPRATRPSSAAGC